MKSICILHLLQILSCVNSLGRKCVVFGKLVQGHEVLMKIESVGDEDGRLAVTVKIINCGEFHEGEKQNAATM